MRICYLADAGSVLIRMRVRYFAQKGHVVYLISFRKGGIEGVNLHYIRPSLTFPYDMGYILSIPKIKRLVRKINPDILHAYYVTSYGFIGACCGFKPFVVSCMGSDIMITPPKSILYKWLTEYALKKASVITSVSEPITERIIKLGIEPQKIQTFPFGVDPEKFFPASGGQKEFALLSMRSLEPIYNIETILKGFSFLKRVGFEEKLVIVGGGPEEKRLKKITEDLGISDHINFMGWVPHCKVAEYLRASQIYLSMSLSDGASTSLLEAMACGAFPIVSDIAANREWIVHGDNGFLVSPLDSRELARCVMEAINNPNLMEKAAKKNFKLIGNKAILQKNLEEVESIYLLITKQI
ncbi:MAG: glycosyltransferase [Candidatus Hodarchaeota archaeon]